MTRLPTYTFLSIVLIGCGSVGDSAQQAPIAITDSAGVRTVTHSAEALANVVTVMPGEALQSLGGIDADEDHDATYMRYGYLLDDGFITLNTRQSRFRHFDTTGAIVAAFGENGEGPGAFRALSLTRLRGDSLALFELLRNSYQLMGPDLDPGPQVRFATTQARDVTPLAPLSDGALLGIVRVRDTSRAMSGPNFRMPVRIMRWDSPAGGWQPVFEYPGPLMYPERGNEGGQDFPAQRYVTFGPYPLPGWWGDAVALARNDNWDIEVHDPHGKVTLRIVTDWPRRAVTEEMRSADQKEQLGFVERWRTGAPQAKALATEQIKRQRYTDSLAPYDRIMAARDGRLWLRENVTAIDTSGTTWLGFDRDGRLALKLVLPPRVHPLDIDHDRILLRSTDDDEIGYVEVRQLVKDGG